MICLNCGSGQRPFHSVDGVQWVNIDCLPDNGPDVICDIGTERLPFDDGSVDVVVLSHVVEHFGCGEATGMIKECHRVLRVGGSLIASVPDLKALSGRWMQGGIEEFIFMINAFGPYAGHETDRHKWGFSQDGLLSYVAATAEWRSVAVFNWRTIPGMDLARDWWIASAEAVK